jgi:hypothetical protein
MAYEKDKKRLRFLKQNVRNYPGQRTNRTVFLYKNCLAQNGILHTPRDIIFLDPPWENPKNNQVDSHVFHFVIRLCNRIAQQRTAKYVFLKLPLQSNHIDDFIFLKDQMSVYWTDINITLSRVKGSHEVPSYTLVCACYKDTSEKHVHFKNQQVSALLAQLHQTCI